jgi:hypothetical protein
LRRRTLRPGPAAAGAVGEYCEEDYGPDWPVVEELRGGHFRTFEPGGGSEVNFEVVTVTGAERDQLWAVLEHGREPHARG